jgi:hypothetical protein
VGGGERSDAAALGGRVKKERLINILNEKKNDFMAKKFKLLSKVKGNLITNCYFFKVHNFC